MPQKRIIVTLVVIIAALSIAATGLALFSGGGAEPSSITSVRGQPVVLYGKGLYHHMSADVAVQGIAQDWVTLCLGVPLLLLSLLLSLRGSLRWRLVLSGTLGYFFVTYLFYLVMAMYNPLFLVYTALLGTTFFALAFALTSFDLNHLARNANPAVSVKVAGIFLLVNSLLIGMLWMSVIVPPLIDGSIYPRSLEHYTTLIVQGFDLGLLLPLSVFSGVLLIRRSPLGFLLGPVYLVFLSLLMTALVSKIAFMGSQGQPIMPAIFIIPVLASGAIYFSARLIRNIS
ncbi:MAG: hypothetical protein HZC28_10745 [Spirochaetes bacterium]|nr:hypothetical protein [Spirochaetota bacterium]